ncbi:hypothetical protein MC885_019606, partial [Smutsia gigantea]
CSSARSRPQYQRLCNEYDYEGSVPERSGEKEEVREEEVAAAAGVLAGVPEAEEGSGVDLDFDLETECTHGKKVKNGLHLRSCRAHSIVSVSCFLLQGKAPELNLQHRGLGPQGPKALASALTSNPYVRQLNLRDNGLCGAGAEALADPTDSEVVLAPEVDLSESPLGASRARAVGAALAGNLALQKLQLAGNGLEEQAAQSLVELLLAHTGLKSLDLS